MTIFRRWHLVILALGLWASPVAAQVDEGQAFLDNGDARAAMIRFERALRDNSDNPAARLGLARALVRLGEFERAEKMGQTAYRQTQDPEAAMVVAEALYGLERFGPAAEALGRADGHPHQPVLRAVIDGERALIAGDPVAALKAVGPAARHPYFGTYARLLAARAQYARGDLARAKRLVDSILADGSDAVPTLLLRAQLALRSGDDSQAKEFADRAMSRDTGNIAAGTILVELALRANDHSAARAVLSTLTPRDASDPRPVFLESLILLSEGRVREAGDLAATIEPWLIGAPGGAVMLANVKLDAGRPAQAERILRDRLQRHPEDRAARRLLVSVFDDTDRPHRGDELIADGLFHDPDDRVLIAFKADRLMARGELDGAIATLQASGLEGDLGLLVALGLGDDRLRADDVVGLENLLAAQAALRQRQPNAAISAANAAKEAGVPVPLADNIRAAALALKGEQAAAVALLDQTIAAHPDFLAAIQNRAQIGGEPDGLLTALEMAADAGAEKPDILALLAAERFVTGDSEGALELARGVSDGSMPGTGPALAYAELVLASENTADGAVVAEVRRQQARLPSDRVPETAFQQRAAALLIAGGAPEDGATVLRRLADGGQNATASLHAASVLGQNGDQEAAIELLALAHAKHPENADVAYGYLEALASRNETSAVRRLETSPSLAAFDGRILRARMQAAGGNRAAAIQKLVSAPKSIDALRTAAMMAETNDERVMVLRAAGPIAAKRPSDVGLQVLVSSLAVDTGDEATAARAIAAGLAAAPGDPVLTNNLAVLRMDRQPEVALGLAERAFRARPQEPEIIRTLIDAYRGVGEADAADRLARRLRLALPDTQELSAR